MTSLRIPSLIAIAAGLGMLVALDRRTLRGDVVACLLLGISLVSHPEAAAFAAAAAVFVLFRPSPERWRRSWVFVAPLALFGTLSLTQSQSGATNPAVDRLSDVASFIGESLVSLTADVSGVSGLITGPAYDSALGWIALGLLLAVVAVALVRRSKPLTPGFWAMLVALAVLLASTAIAPGELRAHPGDAALRLPGGDPAAAAAGRGWKRGAALPESDVGRHRSAGGRPRFQPGRSANQRRAAASQVGLDQGRARRPRAGGRARASGLTSLRPPACGVRMDAGGGHNAWRRRVRLGDAGQRVLRDRPGLRVSRRLATGARRHAGGPGRRPGPGGRARTAASAGFAGTAIGLRAQAHRQDPRRGDSEDQRLVPSPLCLETVGSQGRDRPASRRGLA